MEAGDVGPFEVVEDAACVDEELGGVVQCLSGGEAADLEVPDAFGGVPLRVLDLVPEFDVFADEVVFDVDVLEVREDFGGVGVEVRPGFDFPGELVVDAGDLWLLARSWCALGVLGRSRRTSQAQPG